MLGPDQIEAALRERLGAGLGFLEELVGVNSFTGNASGVNENARIVAERFASLGFRARRVPCKVDGAGEHLVLDTGGEGPVIGCVSHLDTVYTAEEERRNGFAWKVDGERIYGPGVCDIKGGTVMMWMVLDAMARLEPEVFGRARWVLLLNAAEEVLPREFGELCLRELPAGRTRAALVFEADGLVKARKGNGVFRIRVVGRGAHSGGKYAEGANAIHQLARVIDRVMGLTDLSRETTVNVGVVSGGVVTNRVPHEAQARLEVRAFDPAQYAEVKRKLLAMNGEGDVRAASDGFACRVEVVLEKEAAPWPENDGTDRLIALWQRAGEACGVKVEAFRRGGLSDGNWLWETYPTLDGLGPRGGNLHASEWGEGKVPEFVEPGSFVPKGVLNYLAIRQLIVDG